MDVNNPELKHPAAKKTRYDVVISNVNPPKIVDSLLFRSLQKVSHLLSSEVKSKYGIESPNEQSKPVQSEQSIEESELIPSENRNLMVLNDHCLMEIFDFLKPMDVAHLAHVNVRLNKLTKRYIQSKYKIFFAPNFNCIVHDQTVRININIFQAFLCIFGEEMITLTLHNNVFDETYDRYNSMSQIQDFILMYCRLKELTFIGFGMCGLTHQFYADLISLTLDNCSVTREWTEMKNLKTLKLNTLIFRRYPMEYISREMLKMYDYPYHPKPKPIPIPSNCFGALIELQLIDVNIGNDVATKLINSNKYLKRLSICKCREISPFIFGAVGKMRNLIEFEYKTEKKIDNTSYYCALMSLKKLKVLKLFHKEKSLPKSSHRFNYTTYFVSNFVKQKIALDHLELGLSVFDDETALSITKMQNLKILKFNAMDGLNESHIVTIANQLKLLKELHVKMIANAIISQNGFKDIVRAAKLLTCLKIDATGFLLDVETYEAVLSIIQERTIQNHLEITIYGNGNQLAVPKEILIGDNKKWVTVNEVNRTVYSMFEDLTSKIGPPPPPKSKYYSSDSEDSDYY